jgi:quercetin dioxygenase-like cupin family protein
MQEEKVTETKIKYLDDVKPTATAAMSNATLLKMITPKTHGTKYSFNVMRLQPGGVVAVQDHPEEHCILVLSGEGRVLLNEHWFSISQGGFAHIPAGMVHSFENLSSAQVDILILKL